MLRVEIISEENIKPSSPTPRHLKTFNLSILDHLIPAPYAPIILYYPDRTCASDLDRTLDLDLDVEVRSRLEALRLSLSETLTRFYPLAGTIKDGLSISCDDTGAYYAVARVSARLAEFLDDPHLESINRFLPCEPSFDGSLPGSRVANVQVNVFDCGGIVIGLCVSHKILDGAALGTFLKAWAGSTRGAKELMHPDFSASSIFHSDELWLRDVSKAMWGSLFKKGKCSTRRFLFDASSLAALKAEASGVQRSTRVELVSALFWKCAMAAASKQSHGSTIQKPSASVLSHVVNLRKRLPLMLSENSIGNLIWIASTEWKLQCDSGLESLVRRVHESISKIDGEFVKKLQGGNGTDVMKESLKTMIDCGHEESIDYFGFTSWCKMGFYDVDFGWGNPVWVSCSGSGGSAVFMNFIVLVDTRNGDGIEAWVNLDEHEMEILQDDPELMAFASLDPSPLRDRSN